MTIDESKWTTTVSPSGRIVVRRAKRGQPNAGASSVHLDCDCEWCEAARRLSPRTKAAAREER